MSELKVLLAVAIIAAATWIWLCLQTDQEQF